MTGSPVRLGSSDARSGVVVAVPWRSDDVVVFVASSRSGHEVRMTRDEIVALFERRLEASNRGDAAALAADHTEDGTVESPFAGGTATGREAIEQVYRAFFTAFTGLTFRQEALLIDGESAVTLFHVDGKNHGGLMGLPRTDRPFSLAMVSVYEFKDGLIVRERRIYDFTGLLVQIGAVKAKPA